MGRALQRKRWLFVVRRHLIRCCRSDPCRVIDTAGPAPNRWFCNSGRHRIIATTNEAQQQTKRNNTRSVLVRPAAAVWRTPAQGFQRPPLQPSKVCTMSPKASSLQSASPDVKQAEEEQVTQAIEAELTDEQLTQLAEGASSWGAHCNSGGSC